MAEDAEGFDFGMKAGSWSFEVIVTSFIDSRDSLYRLIGGIDRQGSVAMYIGISIVFGAEILKGTN